MKKRASPLEQKFGLIRAIRGEPPANAGALLASLLDEAPFVAAAAADAIRELGLRECLSALESSLVRRLTGEVPDETCNASHRIARGLTELEADAPDAYRLGLRYVRLERDGTDFTDRAVPVRIECAIGIARSMDRRALVTLAPLLADPNADVRSGVARTIATLPGDGPAALLVLKLLSGDEPDVLGSCMSGLLAIEPERHLELVARFLDQEESADVAAIALGESRFAGALPALRKALALRAPGRATRAILLGMALLRLAEATEILFEQLEGAPVALAEQALAALVVHRHVASVEPRVRAIVAGRRSRVLTAALAAGFDHD